MTKARDSQLLTEIAPAARLLTAAEFHGLADVPPVIEWFANLTNPGTRRSTATRSPTSCASPASSARKNSASQRGRT